MPEPIVEKVEETTEEEILETNTPDDEVIDTSDTETEADETDNGDDDLDYDTELEELHKHKKHNFDNASKRIQGKKEPVITDDIVEKIVSQVTEKLSSKQSSDTIEDILSSIDNPKKREIVRFHYENSIVKSGTSRENIQDDIANALAIADRKLNAKRKSEAQETEKAKAGMSKGFSGGSKPTTKSTHNTWQTILNPTEIAFGKSRNWTKEMFEKAASQKRQAKN
jgi:hypothetical protein